MAASGKGKTLIIAGVLCFVAHFAAMHLLHGGNAHFFGGMLAGLGFGLIIGGFFA